MKKLRLFLTVVVLATLSITNVHARAVGDRFEGRVPGTSNLDKVTYQITSIAAGNLTVAIYDTSLTGDVTFPGETADSLNTRFKVTSVLGETNPFGKRNLVNVTFSENLEHFNAYAIFHNNASLKTVTLPKSLVNYNPSAIYGCQNVTAVNIHADNPNFKSVDGIVYSKDGTTLYYYPSGKDATSFTIPAGVTTLMYNAFTRALKLTSLTIPATCTNITGNPTIFCANLATINVASGNPNYSSVDGMLCDKAGTTLIRCPEGKRGNLVNSTIKVAKGGSFTTCHKLTSVELTGVEVVYDSAFNTEWGIKELIFGPALTTLGGMYWMYVLERITIKGDNPNFTTDGDGVLYTKDYKELILCPSAATGSYTTHANCKVIRSGAFQDSHRESIIITNNVEEIRPNAFTGLSSGSVTFQETSKLKKIDYNAFLNGQNLTTITLPASLETIGATAFKGCPLQSVYIKSGSKLSRLDREVFNCPDLETFEFLGTHTADSLSFGERVFAGCSKLVGNSEGTFFMPAAVWHIGESAFNGCSSLTSVTFQQTSTKQPKLERIGFAAFQNSGLLSITLPKSVKHVGNEAFNSCWQLKTVSIPAATEYVGPQAFLFCSGLKEILVDKQNTTYSSVDGMLASKDKKVLYTFPAGKAATYYTMLSPSFETINDSAFYYNRQLRSVTIPKKVTRIGAHAFALCPNLERINFLADNPITDVHAEAFIDMERVSQLPNIDLYVRNGHKGAYQSSSFWNKAKSINESFIASGSELGRVEFFPMSPTDVSIVAVNNSSTSEDMTTFVVPEKVTQGGSTYNVKLIGDYAFEGSDTNIDEVVVPSSVELNYVGARAFVKGNSSPAIKSIFLVNSARPELATSAFGLHDAGVTDNYDEVADGQTIYVKESAESAFKTAWNTMADKITYQIPLPMANTFSTFAREFDADFSEFSVNNTSTLKPGWPKVVAFTAGEYKTDGKDAAGNPMNYIIMESINCDASGNVGTEGDGTYIPAGTGVLLKAIDGSGSASDFYYQIYDKNDEDLPSYTAENLLRGITRSTKEVQPTEGDKTNFIVSGNQLHKMTFARWIPAHKSYLQVPTSMLPTASGAKLAFYFRGLEDFDIDDVVTSIDNGQLTIDNSANGDGEVYDLQGRRVSAPSKGIYVKNGKKVIIK